MLMGGWKAQRPSAPELRLILVSSNWPLKLAVVAPREPSLHPSVYTPASRPFQVREKSADAAAMLHSTAAVAGLRAAVLAARAARHATSCSTCARTCWEVSGSEAAPWRATTTEWQFSFSHLWHFARSLLVYRLWSIPRTLGWRRHGAPSPQLPPPSAARPPARLAAAAAAARLQFNFVPVGGSHSRTQPSAPPHPVLRLPPHTPHPPLPTPQP